MFKPLLLAPFALPLSASVAPPPEHADLGRLRLDQVQYVETHNSYHLAPDPAMLLYLLSSGYSDGPDWPGKRLARATAYSNLPLTTQLELGIRAFELDVHDDPAGGRFAKPEIFRELAARRLPAAAPWDPQGRMREPGFKTLHKSAYDPRSTCPLFEDCLREIAAWSARHRDHMPILVMIETKGGTPGTDCKGLCRDGWLRLEGEISRVFAPDAIVRPAETAAGWPTIDVARGKVMFLLLDEDDAAESYREAARGGGLSILFAGERPGKGRSLKTDRGRWAILPNPEDARIAVAQRVGMLSYTRADADTEEARSGDTRRRDAAMARGATIVSTDYPFPDRRLSNYSVRFGEGGYVRCNPVTAGKLCGN